MSMQLCKSFGNCKSINKGSLKSQELTLFLFFYVFIFHPPEVGYIIPEVDSKHAY